MANWDPAVMAMIGVSAVGFLLSDGEKRRVYYVRAMRKCLMRMNGVIRYEQPALPALLLRMDLRATPQERELTRLLHACARRLESGESLPLLFASERARIAGFGVLAQEDVSAFEDVLCELGRARLETQIRLIDSADERLRRREETLTSECGRRAQLIRALSLCGGAALFLVLV